MLLAGLLVPVASWSVGNLNLLAPTIDHATLARDGASVLPLVTGRRKVLVVLVDGLGAGAAAALPQLAALAGRGAWVEARGRAAHLLVRAVRRRRRPGWGRSIRGCGRI